MTRTKINKAHLNGMEKAMEMNNSRFIIGLALKDDGTVDAVVNMHDSNHGELLAVFRTFMKQYVAGLENLKKNEIE